MVNKKFTASLHTHVKSLFDADITPKALCTRIKELGGTACAITDHGIVTAIEDFRPAFRENGLKLIPGCELYVDGGILGREHLIVLAVNDHGWIGIGKIITEANRHLDSRNVPVITKQKLFEILSAYKGDIVGTSACMQGVICSVFGLNDAVNNEIEKLRNKQSKFFSSESEDFSKAVISFVEAEDKYNEAIKLRDSVKARADQKFTAREKAVAKAEKDGDANAAGLRAELTRDEEDAEKAKEQLAAVTAAAKEAEKNLKAAKKALKDITESINEYDRLEKEIGELSAKLKSDEKLYSIAKDELVSYADAFGNGNFFAEIQYHKIPEEARRFPLLAKLARTLNIPFVATNDVHILNKNEDEMLKRQILRSMRFGDGFEELNVGDEELYLKDNLELSEILREIFPEDIVEEAINNIDVIVDRCNVEFKTGKHYPKFSKTDDANKILEEEVEKGIKWRFPDGMDEEHTKRIKYELSVIESMGYADYHLVVKDFLEYGRLLGYVPVEKLDEAPLTIEELREFIRKNGWKNGGLTIGPGRGSGVGSLVCYCLGITALDPIKYGLLFERFLNPERISMPDIDSDLATSIRDKVVDYVRAKYGNDAVCGIITAGYQHPKKALRTAAKFYGLKKRGEAYQDYANALAKFVPSAPGTHFGTIVDASGSPADKGISLKDYILSKYPGNKTVDKIVHWATVIEDTLANYGAHAAGIVISDNDDISDYLPLRVNPQNGMFTTQCDMVQVEENGLLKFDFLGLSTLDVITDTIRMVERNYGKIIDPLKVDLEDKDVYKKIFSSGKTKAVFQFESNGMRSMLQQFRPNSFEDLILLVAAYRPGPMQYLDGIISVKNGTQKISYLTPELESILSKTYGATIYQEQVMEIFQKLAGYTFGGADMVRRYMSKKKADKLAHEEESFIFGDETRNIPGCIKNGISEDVAREIFTQMKDFAAYAFNKSHAAAYAFNAYLTAWLKLHYPAEFFTAALNVAENDKIPGLVYAAKGFGIDILLPDVNLSDVVFSADGNAIRYGLSAILGIGSSGAAIYKERSNGTYTSIIDFLHRTSVNRTAVINLVKSGAFDRFSKNRAAMIRFYEESTPLMKKISEKQNFIESAEYLASFEDFEKVSTDELLERLLKTGKKKIEFKNSSLSAFQNRITTAKKTLAELTAELKDIGLLYLDEDRREKLEEEKKLLGMYISGHPLDTYPAAEEINALSVKDLMESEDLTVYGLVSNLKIKNRKSDGAPMAFFDLEDKTGSVEVCCFTKAYSEYGQMLKDGMIVKISGRCEDESYENDEGEIVDEKLKVFVRKVEPVQPLGKAYIMEVTSYAVFHLNAEVRFKDMYKGENPFYIFDRALNEIRRATYKVSDAVKNLPKVEEY